jgi:6-pyruvoyltetrahydropterin/6-carboxytetrahydropterin synthase
MVEIFKRFTFEAAHTLPQFPSIHGHSYSVEVRCAGPADGGYVMAEDEFDSILSSVRGKLDHRMLNELIEVPTSENIARWLWTQLASRLPLSEVRVWRESVGFGAIYRGD